jgi:glycosyltransferase involved in cell wall biosynthesis
MNRRILYIQFADAAAYPPVQHSTGILADRGWDIVLLGTDAFGDRKLKLPTRPRIRMKNSSLVKAGLPLGLEYLVLLLRSLYWTCVWRPAWIYASDPFSLPVIWLLRKLTNTRIVYHEHDAPTANFTPSRFMEIVLACRETLGREVELCIIPQQERLLEFLKVTGRKRSTMCVWNCPKLSEIQENTAPNGDLIIYYHGSINRERVPAEVVVAASRFKGAVRVRIAGYEAPGSAGYVEELMKVAVENGAPGLVEFLGVIPREHLLCHAADAHVGLSLMPNSSDDINLQYMVGASNKPFDYMACGLPLLVTELPEWSTTFVEPGYALACNPTDVSSIETALGWFLGHPNKRREMGRRCTDKIRQAWNYESMFADVTAKLESN